MRGILRVEMAGAGGFEPPNGGIKTRCLAAWRRPNNLSMLLHRVAVYSLCDEGLKLARGVTGNLLVTAFVERGEHKAPLWSSRGPFRQPFQGCFHWFVTRLNHWLESLRTAPSKKADTVIGGVLRVNSER